MPALGSEELAFRRSSAAGVASRRRRRPQRARRHGVQPSGAPGADFEVAAGAEHVELRTREAMLH
eukprot:6258805-Alexandrium_andersonii.AAC.1